MAEMAALCVAPLGLYVLLAWPWYFAAFALALLPLAHNAIALLMFPTFIAISSSRGTGWRSPRALAGAVGLSAYFWLPALFEMQYVRPELLRTDFFDYHRHFIWLNQLVWGHWQFGYSPLGMDYALGLPHIALALTGLFFAYGVANHRDRATRWNLGNWLRPRPRQLSMGRPTCSDEMGSQSILLDSPWRLRNQAHPLAACAAAASLRRVIYAFHDQLRASPGDPSDSNSRERQGPARLALSRLWRGDSDSERISLVCAFAAASIIGAFLATGYSTPVWDHISILQYFQFPWRTLALPALFMPLLSLWAFEAMFHVKHGHILIILTIAILIAVNLSHAQPKGYINLNDAYFTPANIAASGWETTTRGEYEPEDAATRDYLSHPTPIRRIGKAISLGTVFVLMLAVAGSLRRSAEAG